MEGLNMIINDEYFMNIDKNEKKKKKKKKKVYASNLILN